MFNRNIDNIDAIKEDVKAIFEEYDLIPSDNTNYLEFENYYRKKNYTDRVVYNGNKSFFLEPLESSSIVLINHIQRIAFDLWNNAQTPQTLDNLNLDYIRNVSETETMIMLHYFAGSVYDTEFWKFSNEQGKKCIETAVKYDSKFIDIIKHAVETKHSNLCDSKLPDYGCWWPGSFCQNLQGLGIESILQDYLKAL